MEGFYSFFEKELKSKIQLEKGVLKILQKSHINAYTKVLGGDFYPLLFQKRMISFT